MTSSSTAVAVPLLDLAAQYRPIRDAILQAITRVADSQRYIMGPEVEAFEREMAAMLEVEHAIGVSSGTDALLVVLMALGIGPGDEVITPTYSFFATAGSVSRVGATPVFVDIEPGTFNIDAAALARAVTPRTRAIVPVHLFGLPADMDAVMAVAARAGAVVIEDAAQAMGARYHGRQVGSFGLVTGYSFFPTKNLGAFGDAGLVTTNDAALARDIIRLREHGADRQYVHERVGGNFRLDAMQAAILRVKRPHLPAWSHARRDNAARYRELFREFGIDGDVESPVEPPGCHHIYNQFVIATDERDRLREHLATHRIGTAVYYPVPFHRQACFEGAARAAGPLPVADRAAARSLALPIYGELSDAQQRHVASSLASFFAGTR
jgi:dTDP-4-amino-4,6-dideoxygalactose transaminase